jgi:hypothetical protein
MSSDIWTTNSLTTFWTTTLSFLFYTKNDKEKINEEREIK